MQVVRRARSRFTASQNQGRLGRPGRRKTARRAGAPTARFRPQSAYPASWLPAAKAWNAGPARPRQTGLRMFSRKRRGGEGSGGRSKRLLSDLFRDERRAALFAQKSGRRRRVLGQSGSGFGRFHGPVADQLSGCARFSQHSAGRNMATGGREERPGNSATRDDLRASDYQLNRPGVGGARNLFEANTRYGASNGGIHRKTRTEKNGLPGAEGPGPM